MNLIITATYSDLFSGEKPLLENLLSELPSDLILSLLSKLNAELYIRPDHPDTQIRIFQFLIQHQPLEIKKEILDNLANKILRNPNEPVQFFTTVFNLEFIHYELLNFKSVKLEDTTPQHELNFIKAYFIIAENVTNRYVNSFEENKDENADYFEVSTWPTLFDQFEVNHRSDPVIGMIRGLAFLNYLQYHSEFSCYVKKFLSQNEKATSWNYVLDILGLFKSCWDNFRLNENISASFSLQAVKGFNELFSRFSMNKDQYKEKYNLGKSNFSGLKSQPLFKVGDRDFIVLDWNLLAAKLYEGLLFDFYSSSGINAQPRFKEYLNFKNYVAEEVTEGYVFKKLLTHILKKKYAVLEFGNKSLTGFPDCYYRKNNNLVLFEIKDAYFPAKAINSFSYQDIKTAIDTKYNTHNKGTGQLIKQLKYLRQQSFESFKKYSSSRNFTIYPVIIYTDMFFGCSGVNAYLAKSFHKQLVELNLRQDFKNVKNLTCIPLSFLIKHIHPLNEQKVNIIELIDTYHKTLRANHKKFARNTDEMEVFFSLYDPFEDIMNIKYPEVLKKDKGFVKTIMEVLNLTEGLPKE